MQLWNWDHLLGISSDRIAQEEEGSTAMNVTIEKVEDVLSCDVSDEALEIAGTAWQEIAGGYTLQYCTATDCALVTFQK